MVSHSSPPWSWTVGRFLQSFQLFSFEFTGTSSSAHLSEIIYSLPTTLRRLTVSCAIASRLICIELPGQESPPQSFSHLTSPEGAWIVSKSFPRLQYLRLTNEHFVSDPVIFTQFMLGLPSSLHTLHLPFTPPVNLWRLLPMNLSSIEVMGALPSSIPHLEKITDLRLHFSHPPLELDWPRWAPIYDFKHFNYPPHLTNLYLSGLRLDSKVLEFPTSLTSIHLQSFEISPSALLIALPPFLTSLKTNNIKLLTDDKSLEPNSTVFKYLKNVDIQCSNRPYKQVLGLYSCLLRAFSLAESISIQSNGFREGLTLEHLAILNGSPLRKLSARFDSSCFYDSSDGLRFGELLPNLTELHVFSTYGPTDSAHFGVLPSSLTLLHLKKFSFPLQTLRKIPLGVNVIVSGLTIDMSEQRYFDFIFPFLSTSTAQTQSELNFQPPYYADVTILPESRTLRPTILDLTAKYALRCYRLNDGISDSAPLRGLFPQPSEFHEPCISLDWSRAHIPWPSSLTEIRLDSVPIGAGKIPDSTLPLLHTLYLPTIGPRIQLGDFKSLKTLVVGYIPQHVPSACPPNLTKLICAGNFEESSYFAPLPSSLTCFSCSVLGHPSHVFTSLSNLTHFQCSDVSISLGDDWYKDLPSSISHLGLPETTATRCASTILAQFPLLKQLTLCRPASEANDFVLFHKLYTTLPPHVKFRTGSQFRNSDCCIIASRAGYSHGELLLRRDEKIHELVLRIFPKAYPRLTSKIQSLTSCSIVSFLPYLSPSNVSLSFETLPTDAQSQLPKSLTKLQLTDQLCLRPEALPTGLKQLIIPNVSCDANFVQTLPRSLVYLSILRHTSDCALLWPPGLVTLVTNPYTNSIKGLPPSLKAFVAGNCPLAVDDFLLLPSGLTFFQGDVEDENVFSEFINARGISWAKKAPSITFRRPGDIDSMLDSLVARSLSGSKNTQ